jgi:hypothetical protein
MEKINIDIKKKIPAVHNFQEQEIKILPYIPYRTKFGLIETYVSDMGLTEDICTNYLLAENRMIVTIIKDCTNIDLNMTGDNGAEVIENIYSSGLWDFIKSKFINYDELRKEIEFAVDLDMKKKASIKEILSYISAWINAELKPEEMKDILSKIEELSDKKELAVKKTRRPKKVS